MKRFNKNDKLLVRLFLATLLILAAMHPEATGRLVTGSARIIAAVLEAAADNIGAALTAAAIVYTWRKLHTLTRRTATARA